MVVFQYLQKKVLGLQKSRLKSPMLGVTNKPKMHRSNKDLAMYDFRVKEKVKIFK